MYVRMHVCNGVLGITEAKRHCGFFYEMLNARWASDVDCNLLPDSTDENVCVGGLEVREHVEHKGIRPTQATIESHIILLHIYSCRNRREAQLLRRILVSGCKTSQIACDSNQCIPHAWVCDGVRDCVDNTDETNCGTLM